MVGDLEEQSAGDFGRFKRGERTKDDERGERDLHLSPMTMTTMEVEVTG